MAGDTFFNPDPLTAGTLGDVFMNTAGGDVWFDVITHWYQDTSWDILNVFLQNIAWDILNENNQDIAWDILNAFAQNVAWDILNSFKQDISWSVFAETLYYLQQFFVKQICFDYNIDEPVNFTRGIYSPLEFTYYPTGVITETINLPGFSFDTISIANPPAYNFQIKQPLVFTINVQNVTSGSKDTIRRN